MKTKLMLALIFVLGLAMSAFAQDDAAMKADSKMVKTNSTDQVVIDKEQTAWKSLQDKNWSSFSNMLAADYQGFSINGISDKNKEMDNVKLGSFVNMKLSDMKVSWIDKDTALVTSIISLNAANSDGKMENQKARTVSIWTKRGKDWLVVYHTDIPIN